MDSEYLKKNVLGALTEALGAMSIQNPDDQVEFLGKYLLSYVQREYSKSRKEKENIEIDEKLAIQKKIDAEKEKVLEEKNAPLLNISTQYTRLVESIPLKSSKEEAIESAVTFLESTMNFPASYYGVKMLNGETEIIKYLFAGPSSQVMIGKKLQKPAVEDQSSDEFVERQGVSFEAFKVPEVPEGEEPPADEGETPSDLPPKGPPPLKNLIITNVMRDRRIKFFGIPKLGSYVACPFKYSSFDHDGSVRFNPGDGAEVQPSFELVKSDVSFMFGFDSIGQYRLFHDEEINRVTNLGNMLIQLFEKLESKAAEKQLEFVNGPNLKKINETITEITPKIAEAEAAALAALQPPEGAEPPPAETSEFLKPKKESAVINDVWNKFIGGGALGPLIILLQGYVLPLPSSALKLLNAIALLLNYYPESINDVCGDLSWENYKKNVLPTLSSKILTFMPEAELELINRENSLSSIKTYIETNNLNDASIYPSFMSIFPTALLPWLNKAIIAREAAMTYSAEVDKKSLEIFV